MTNIYSIIKKAKNYLINNDIIGIPTETVYGLAGNAYSNKSVKKIFSIKKRPLNNPLIVHYINLKDLQQDCYLNENFIKLHKKFFHELKLFNWLNRIEYFLSRFYINIAKYCYCMGLVIMNMGLFYKNKVSFSVHSIWKI